MSSSAYASVLKNLGGGFRTKNPDSAGGSGSGPPQEDAAESVAPVVPTPVVGDAGDDGNVVGVVNAGKAVDLGDDPSRAPKKRKLAGTKPLKSKEPAVEKVVCDEGGNNPDGEQIRIGNFSLEQLANTMSEIPSDEDWVTMEESGLSAVLKRLTGHWGHVSISQGSCVYVSLCLYKFYV